GRRRGAPIPSMTRKRASMRRAPAAAQAVAAEEANRTPPRMPMSELELHCNLKQVVFDCVRNRLVTVALFNTTVRSVSAFGGRGMGSVNPLLGRSVLVVEDEPLHRTRTLHRVGLCRLQRCRCQRHQRSASAEVARNA